MVYNHESIRRSLGSDSQLKCLTAYVTDNTDHMGGKMVEQALYSVGKVIDDTFGPLDDSFKDTDGTTISNKHTKRTLKYLKALKDVVNILPPGCSQIKPYFGKNWLHLCTNQIALFRYSYRKCTLILKKKLDA